MKARVSNYRILRASLPAVIIFLLLIIAPAQANRAQAEDSGTLPYSGTLSLAREESGAKWLELECKKLSIVAVSARALTEGALPELSVYTDDGALIHSVSPNNNTAVMQFLPAYTGLYRVLVEYKGADCPSADISLDIREHDGYKLNEADALPFSLEYTAASGNGLEADLLYGQCTDAEGYTLNVFSFPHSAGGILSYKITAPDADARAVLYTYDGAIYRAYPSHSAAGYCAGDARETAYSENSYLIVYSRTEFSLEASLLERRELKPSSLSLPYLGKLDVGGAEQSYDSEAFERTLATFPFSDIENPHVAFYEISAGSASVVTLLCERREHANFSLVSAEYGLSADSSYPLRKFGSYCSETRPTELCYDSVLCDSGTLYLAYTGSADSVYIELEASPSHQSQTEYLNEYNKSDIIPHAVLDSVYSDGQIYERIGAPVPNVDITKITGYLIESEDGTRYYYSASDDITPPYKKGECKLWVMLTSTGTNGTGDKTTFERRLLLCRFSTTGVIIIPTIDEVIDSIKSGEPVSIVYILLILIPIAVLTAASVLIIKLKRKKAATSSTPPEISTQADQEKEEAAPCSDSSNQEENASSRQ